MVQSATRRTVGLLFLLMTCCACMLGQTARLSGHVTDPAGLVVPGATVQVIHQGDLIAQKTTTDETGAYTLTQLGAGDYQIVVDAPGFDTYKGQIVHLTQNQALVVEIQVIITTAKSEINVTAQASPVTLDTAALSGTLEAKEVATYGLNGRNFSQLIALTPGVSNQTGQDEAKVGVAGSAKFSVNGGRVEYNTFEVDGSDVLNTSINASRGQGLPLMVYPSVDAIQEMQVLTSNYGAMYGKSASGSVLVTTKSGTATFHGNVYGFIRNEMFNARNYFDPAEPINSLDPNAKAKYRTPLYRRQDYGGTIGGPIYIPNHYNTKKDKTFFFFSEELRLEKTPVDYHQAVPTLAERSGDFSDVCPYSASGSDLQSTAGYPDCPVRIANPGQSTGFVNPNYLSQAILSSNIIPLPNSPSGCNSTNTSLLNHCYVAAVSPPTYWREELFRIDHALTPTHLLSFRYIHDAWNTTTLTPQWGVVQNSFPTVENKLTGPGLDMVLSLAQSLPHNFQNRISFGFSVEHISLASEVGPGVTSLQRPAILDSASPSVTGGVGVTGSPQCSVVTGGQPTPPSSLPSLQPQQLIECPMGHIFNNGFGSKMPGLVFQGNNGAYGGHGFNVDTGYTPWNQSNPTYVIRDDASTVVFGKHFLQFGFEATLSQQNELSAASGANSGDLQGLLTFSNQQSRYTTGNSFADFLAGPGLYQLAPAPGGSGIQPHSPADYNVTAIKSFTQDSGQGRYYNRYKAAEFYLQDDWHLTNRLTLNLGFRGSLFGAWYNPNNTAYNWEPQAFNQSLGSSIYIDPNFGELVRTTGSGSSGPGSLPTVPLNLSNLDPVITNGLVQCGSNGVPNSCMTNHLFNPAPRIGFALDPFGDGRTSIRAGYGLFWEHGIGNEANTGSLIGSAPLVLSETQSNPAGVNVGPCGGTDLCNGLTNSIAGPLNSIGLVSSGIGTAATVSAGTFPLNVTAIPTKQHYSYTQQWSLSVQRELFRNVVGTIAYVGTKGTHLTAIRDLNQLPALPSNLNPFGPGQPLTSATCSSGATAGVFPVSAPYSTFVPSSVGIGPNQPGYLNAFVACTGSAGFKSSAGALGVSADALRPYLGFSNIISVENVADSQYHALQVLVRRTKGALTIGASYTYSHALDDSSDRSSANFADSLNIKSNWASSDFDARHLINFSYIYDLPLLRLVSQFNSDGGIANSAFVKSLLGAWHVSGITVYQTGTPFSIVNGGDQSGIATADNAGVGNGLGIGSYPDINPGTHGTRPVIVANGSTVGPLLGNPRAFVAPRALTFGNAGRNYMNNPSRTNFNVSLLKNFKPLERFPMEFRIEAFNVFNHTQFRIYDPSHPGNTGNNVINCYGDISTGYSAGTPGCVAGNSFLHPVDAHDPRILQLGLKIAF